MKRREFIAFLGSAAATWPLAARVQQAGAAALTRLGVEFDLLMSAYDQLAAELQLLGAQFGIHADELMQDHRRGHGSGSSARISNIQEEVETMVAMLGQLDTIANAADQVLRRILTS